MAENCSKIMLYNIKYIPLQRVFHGIRFKVSNLKIGCRDDNLLFLYTYLIWRKKGGTDLLPHHTGIIFCYFYHYVSRNW